MHAVPNHSNIAGHWDETDNGDPVPLQRASRNVRAEAANVIEEFLEALYVQLDEMEAAMDKANPLLEDKQFADVDPEIKALDQRAQRPRACEGHIAGRQRARLDATPPPRARYELGQVARSSLTISPAAIRSDSVQSRVISGSICMPRFSARAAKELRPE